MDQEAVQNPIRPKGEAGNGYDCLKQNSQQEFEIAFERSERPRIRILLNKQSYKNSVERGNALSSKNFSQTAFFSLGPINVFTGIPLVLFFFSTTSIGERRMFVTQTSCTNSTRYGHKGRQSQRSANQRFRTPQHLIAPLSFSAINQSNPGHLPLPIGGLHNVA